MIYACSQNVPESNSGVQLVIASCVSTHKDNERVGEIRLKRSEDRLCRCMHP